MVVPDKNKRIAAQLEARGALEAFQKGEPSLYPGQTILESAILSLNARLLSILLK